MQEDSVYDPLVFGHRDYIYCSNCEARIARVQYYIPNVQDLDYRGYFKRVDMLMYKSRVTLHDSLFGGANRQDHVQDVGANADQDAGANADQDRDAKKRIMIKMKPLMNKVLMNNDQDGSRPMKQMKM
uniref:Yippee domain-containing protein n=1 Tax=Solanum tuberosum TaxID=4113 RepID=M1DHR6_SOLTU